MPENLSPIIKFLVGAIPGLVLFGALWAMCAANPIPFTVMIMLVGNHLVGGVILCCCRDWRAFGAGLATSVPLAIMIFVTLCLAIYMNKGPMPFH